MFIRAALDVGQPPTAVILSDPTHKEWDETDYHLVKAYHMKQGFMDGNYPIWIDRSDRVTFEMKSYVSKSSAASERKEEQVSKATNKHYGQRWYPVPVTMDGGPMPTYREWMEEESEKKGRARPEGPPRN